MPSWFPRSIFGTVLVIAYVAVAVFLVGRDRKTTSGGWISIQGLVSYLATFPISALGERLGVRPNYDRNRDMAFAIGGCAVIVYLIGAGLGALAKLMFSSTTPPVT